MGEKEGDLDFKDMRKVNHSDIGLKLLVRVT